MMITRRQVRDNLSVAGDSWDYFVFDKLPRMDGYTRCVLDVSVNNATQSGAGSSLIVVNSCTAAESNMQVNLRNMATGAARIKISVCILYIKDQFITIEEF